MRSDERGTYPRLLGRRDAEFRPQGSRLPRLPTICAALAVVLLGTACGPASEPVDTSGVELRTIEPSEVAGIVAESDDALVLVNVWATWCGPCVEEFPHLVRLDREYRDRDFGVVFVSVDEGEDDSKVRRFLARQGVDFESYRHPGMSEALVKAITPQWSGALPGSFLFRDGRLIEIWEGGQSYATFERRLLDEI